MAENASGINVGNPERWLSVVAGTALMAYGLAKRSVSGVALAGVGGVLAWRGATGHCPLYASLRHPDRGRSGTRPNGPRGAATGGRDRG